MIITIYAFHLICWNLFIINCTTYCSPCTFPKGIIKLDLILSDISGLDSEFPSLRYENLGNSSLFILTHNIPLNYFWQEKFLSDIATE